jgi:hypothetical protein
MARDAADQGWGLLATIRLPDGSEFPIYEPRHPSPLRPCLMGSCREAASPRGGQSRPAEYVQVQATRSALSAVGRPSDSGHARGSKVVCWPGERWPGVGA